MDHRAGSGFALSIWFRGADGSVHDLILRYGPQLRKKLHDLVPR
jgi:hypothetical protein